MNTLRTFCPMLLILLALAMGCQTSRPPLPKDYVVSAVSGAGGDIGGVSYNSKLTGEDLLGAPRWPAGHDQPPLTAGAAKRAALKTLAETVTDPQQWKLEEIGLKQPFAEEFGPEYWIYELSFSGPKYQSKSGYTMGSNLRIMVLMNGRVLKPEPLQPQIATPVSEAK